MELLYALELEVSRKIIKNLDSFPNKIKNKFIVLDGVTEIAVPVEMIHFIFNNLISGYFFEIYQDIANKKVFFYKFFHLSNKFNIKIDNFCRR